MRSEAKSRAELERATRHPHFHLGASTDDRPFFFYTLRAGDALEFWAPETRSENAANEGHSYMGGLLGWIAVTAPQRPRPPLRPGSPPAALSPAAV